ncbi:hypothetical protein ACFSM5_18525 [Lacibacterium aquatile]|uniref:Uncharacterized protein n=1 Tax=Lacibacterium aquatile TaxID=1168082 RepID=A0ABW5DUU6_9PROT
MKTERSVQTSSSSSFTELALTMAVTAMVFGVGAGFTTWVMVAIKIA